MKAAGIIGNDVIGKIVAEIDYADGTLNLYPPGAFTPPTGADVVPVTLEGNLPFIRTRIVPIGRRSIGAKCELDTGSTGTVLFNTPYVRKYRLVSSLTKSMTSKSGGVGGTGTAKVGRITSLEFGRSTIRTPIAVLFQGARGDNASNKYDCLIGGAIFRRFKIVFDLAGRRVFLQPTASLNDPFETDMSGMELLADGEELKTILIDEVRVGSAAARAGVKGGDVLEAINGHPVAELGLPEVRRLLRKEGAQYELILRRNKSEIKVRIRLTRVI